MFNGNFVAATRLLFALGRRNLVHPELGAVHPRHGTPTRAIIGVAALTAVAAFLGDAVLVPITEVGSLAAGVGWCAAGLAFLARRSRAGEKDGVTLAILGVVVSLAIVLMKVIPAVPGSFSGAEWIVLSGWCTAGVVAWRARRRAPSAARR